jgi:hypothetical protein
MTYLSKFLQAPFFTEDYGNAIQFSRFRSLSLSLSLSSNGPIDILESEKTNPRETLLMFNF